MELAEQLVELAEVFAEVLALTASGTELVIRQPKELKVFNSLRLSIVLLLAIRYWDSLKS